MFIFLKRWHPPLQCFLQLWLSLLRLNLSLHNRFALHWIESLQKQVYDQNAINSDTTHKLSSSSRFNNFHFHYRKSESCRNMKALAASLKCHIHQSRHRIYKSAKTLFFSHKKNANIHFFPDDLNQENSKRLSFSAKTLHCYCLSQPWKQMIQVNFEKKYQAIVLPSLKFRASQIKWLIPPS